MGDEIVTRFADADMDRSRLREEFSPSTADHLSAVLRTVNGHLDDVMDALEHRDVQKAKRVQRTKSSLRLELDALRSHLLTQLSASSGERVRILGLESDAVEVAKRLNDQIRLVAKLVIDTSSTRTGS
jgi:Na+/phosphate symporter